MKKLIVIFLTSFLLWYWFSTIGANFLDSPLSKTQKVSSFPSRDLDLTHFWKAYSIIEQEYFREWKIEKQELIDGAIEWMVNALWDEHSEFMNPELTQKFESSLNGDFEWIGAVVEKVAAWVKIERVLKWSPAKKFDIRADDILISANSDPLQDLDIFDAIEKIKWPAWTSVILEIIRPWEEKILTITVVRDKIHIPSVQEEYFQEEGIWYIALNMFWETTVSEFTRALDNMKWDEVRGIIIDMRDNGGWYLQSAVQILSEFVPKGEVLVKTKYMNSLFNENYYSVNSWEVFDKKIVVLINWNSASASEITAGALREYDKAILVGEKSYGKWSVQQPFDFDNGSLLKLTVAEWFTPQGNSIEDWWISPDIEINFQDDDYDAWYDRQLEEAKKVLESYIEKSTLALAIEAYKTQAEKEQSVNEKSQD